jgi:hypothetical protein
MLFRGLSTYTQGLLVNSALQKGLIYSLEKVKNEKTKMMNQVSSKIDQYHYFGISEGLLFNAMLVILSYSTAQRENTKSASFQGLSQRGINEKSLCKAKCVLIYPINKMYAIPEKITGIK